MPKKKSSGRLSLKTALFKGAYIHNPVLTSLVGLCPIAAVAINFKNALYLSLAYLLVITVSEVLASAVFKRFSRWVRICLYAVVSCAVLLPVFLKINAQTASAFGVYLPLLCVSGVTVIRCEKFAVRTTVYNSFIDSVACAVGYGAVSIAVGLIRGFLASGKIFSFNTHFPSNTSIAMPFGAFVVLGFLAALHKWSVMKFFPNELVDTFNLSSAFEKPVFKDPGLGAGEEHRKTRKLEEDMEEYDKIRPRYSIEDIDPERLEAFSQKGENSRKEDK
ncbi:MAG: Rnf-Nqr domain containing protein [Acutalibacteraceae bacterium]